MKKHPKIYEKNKFVYFLISKKAMIFLDQPKKNMKMTTITNTTEKWIFIKFYHSIKI